MRKPPFNVTLKILKLASEIQELLGELKLLTHAKPSPKLRKENKLRTVHHSLAIEGNSLSLQQVTALLEKKRVAGPKNQIQEVVNALELYEQISTINPLNEKSLLKSHSVLMKTLVSKPGTYRDSNVGTMKGQLISHVAPQPRMVPELMKNLFKFLNHDKEVTLLLKACIFHYELEFIHPFEDGNGRMGRLWQQAILIQLSPIFEYVSVETLIHGQQKQYYKVLEACDKAGDSTEFIEFSLNLILESLKELQLEYRPRKMTGTERVALALETIGEVFTRKDYLIFYKEISTATASRDLAEAVKQSVLKKRGDKALASYSRV